ncbi:MAG: M14 family metallopeptidase [Planctomycetota bacterium]
MASLAALLVLASQTFLLAAPPQSPNEFLGRPICADFELADWEAIARYFRELDLASERIVVERVDGTTEGRDFLIAIISSEENLRNLPELKRKARRIADPRGLGATERAELLASARPFVFISCNMHSTEIASAEMSMQLAHELATSEAEPWKSARRELVVVLIPSVNPDGQDQVVKWYRQIRGTPFEAADLTELYQLYAGHDNNRDWFMLSLQETRIVTRLLYREWLPQVYWDVHQQGSKRERMFVPPFRDPLNPNLAPGVVCGIGALGARMLFDLTTEGLTGVSTGVTYDLWWAGGNRNIPLRHNMVGLLTEAASANLASPMFLPISELVAPRDIETGYRPSNRFPLPWPGGWWRVGDIAKYELAAARSLLASVAREPRTYLQITLDAATEAAREKADDPPFAWLLTPDIRDRNALARLLNSLIESGVEVESAQAPFQADGLAYAAGTLIIRRAQPYGEYVKDLFEVQRYPDGPAPYDVAGWTLPLLLGVRRVEVITRFEVATQRATTVAAALAALPRAPRAALPWPALDGLDGESFRGVIALLAAGVPVGQLRAAKEDDVIGDFVVANEDEVRARAVLAPMQIELRSVVRAEKTEAFANSTRPLRLPRLGLYAPWTSSMDEGWTRWVLEHYELPYQRVRNEAIRAGRLNDWLDVLILPNISEETLRNGRREGSVFPRFAGGLEPEGLVAIEEFVRAGGVLITFEQSSDFAINLFALPLENVAAAKGDDGFKCPGSILRTVVVDDTEWTAGFDNSQPVFFSDSRAYRIKAKEKDKEKEDLKKHPRIDTLLRFPESSVLLSGWVKKPDQIAGAGAWLTASIDAGRVHLFSFRPQYRSWSQTTFKMLLRAILHPPKNS